MAAPAKARRLGEQEALYIAPASWPRAPGPGVPISELFPEQQDLRPGSHAVCRSLGAGAAEVAAASAPASSEPEAERSPPASSAPASSAPACSEPECEKMAEEFATEILKEAEAAPAPAGAATSVASPVADDEAWQAKVAAAELSPLDASSESSHEVDTTAVQPVAAQPVAAQPIAAQLAATVDQPMPFPKEPQQPQVGQLYLVSSDLLRPADGRLLSPDAPKQIVMVRILPTAEADPKKRSVEDWANKQEAYGTPSTSAGATSAFSTPRNKRSRLTEKTSPLVASPDYSVATPSLEDLASILIPSYRRRLRRR